MASSKKPPRVADLTLKVLQEIRGEARQTNERLARVEAELHEMRESHGAKLDAVASLSLTLCDRVDHLETATVAGFAAVRRELDGTNRRLDGLRDLAGAKVREHDARLDDLEDRVGELEGRRQRG